MQKHVFQDGAMWEDGPWFIHEGEECSKNGGGAPCKHCHSERVITHECYTETVWTCPRVVVATNEAGHNSTGVCLDCILEAARSVCAS
jgi:hypothetical protein